ncbi:MAG TPA: hypothetical protein VMW80_07855 [Candidatus Dormibacteraeota bacterium]|nr:hypothetical protein [Candidatus Dormibacteraeota bacterium]
MPLGVRLSVPVVILAVVGAVVAFGFGYQLLGDVVAAAVVAGLVLVSVIHHRRSTAVGDPGWWR